MIESPTGTPPSASGHIDASGSNLGRAMFDIMLEQALARLGDYQLLDGAERYPSTGAFPGDISVPVRFTPGARLHAAPGS